MFLRNICICLQLHTALLLRRPTSTSLPPWQPQISQVLPFAWKLFSNPLQWGGTISNRSVEPRIIKTQKHRSLILAYICWTHCEAATCSKVCNRFLTVHYIYLHNIPHDCRAISPFLLANVYTLLELGIPNGRALRCLRSLYPSSFCD
jgi:hypothetical protein